MKKLIILGLWVFLSQGVTAQNHGLSSVNEIKDYTGKIMQKFRDGQVAAAFVDLKNIWLMPTEELDKIEGMTKKNLEAVKGRFGEKMSYVLVKEEKIDKVLYRINYVLKYEKHGLRFTFSFYNGKFDRWYLNNFKWDDAISKLLDEN